MTNLIAYTTLTIKAPDGTDVQLWAEAENSSLSPGETTKIYVFTSPSSYLSYVTGQVTEGSLSLIGIETLKQDGEDVTLTKKDFDSLAAGSLKYEPVTSVSAEPISLIGSYSGVSFSGRDVIANSLDTYALVLKCSYSYKAKVFRYTASLNPKADKAICMWSLDA